MTIADLVGVTTWQVRLEITDQAWKERMMRAEGIARLERATTPREWTWLHGGKES